MGPSAGCPTRATPRASLGPFVARGSQGAVSRGIYGGGGGWAGGRFLRENKGPARRGRLPPRPGPSLVAARKLGLGLGEELAALLFAQSGAEVSAAMLWPRPSGGFPHAPCVKERGYKDERKKKLPNTG